VRFTIDGGINGRDYDWIDNWATIPAGASKVSVRLIPGFPFGDTYPKSVTMTLVPGGYRVGTNGKATIVTRVQ